MSAQDDYTHEDLLQISKSWSNAQRVNELLEANNRFEQRGRMAKRAIELIERMVMTGCLNRSPTVRDMALILIAEYRKDNPK